MRTTKNSRPLVLLPILCFVLTFVICLNTPGADAAPGLSRVSALQTGGFTGAIAFHDHYAFLGDNVSGLMVIDVKNPQDPELVTTATTLATPVDIFISGNYAILSESAAGLEIFDISDPGKPQKVKEFSNGSFPLGTQVVDDIAYVADFANGLQILKLNLGKPQAPVLIGSAADPTPAINLYVTDGRAFVSAYNQGLQIFDISDPTQPLALGSVDTPGIARDVCVSGKYAYVADHQRGVQVVDVSNPLQPKLAASLVTPGFAQSILIQDGLLYVSAGTGGIHLIDANNPQKPILLDTFNDPNDIRDAAVVLNHVFLADGLGGLKILKRINKPSNISGIIRSDGAPAKSFPVDLYKRIGAQKILIDSTNTNLTGNYTFSKLKSGRYFLDLSQLPASKSIYGRIAMDGSPQSGLIVKLYKKVANKLVWVTSQQTDAEGVFNFTKLSQEVYTINVLGPVIP